MGACKSKNKKKNINKETLLKKQIYSINKFNSQIVPSQKIDKPLTFEVRLHNFKAKGLSEDKIYWMKIEIGPDKNFVLELPITKGPDPKFLLDKVVFLKVEFEKLKSTYMDMYLYSQTFHKDIKNSNALLTKAKQTPCCILSIDFLTLVIGPEHHDINLIHINKNTILGRISFDINCQQSESISLQLSSIKCKLNHRLKNEISLKMKYFNNLSSLDTDFTKPIKGEINKMDDCTEYIYKGEYFEQDTLSFNKVMLTMNELRSCNLEVRIFETNYELNENKEKEDEYFNNEVEVKRTKTQKVFKHKIFPDGSSMFKPEEKEEEVNLSSENYTPRGDRYNKLIVRESVLEKFGADNEKILEVHKIDEKSKIILKPHYNEVGWSNIDFYHILAQQEKLMFNQSSQVFQKFSYLYQNFALEPKDIASYGKRRNSLAVNPKDIMLFLAEQNMKEQDRLNLSFQQDEKANNNKNIQKNEKMMKTENNLKSENNPKIENNKKLENNLLINEDEKNLIKFQVFNNIKKSSFKQEIIFDGKVVGQLKGLISIHNVPLIRQMVCGVHTERGLDISANFLFQQQGIEKSDDECLPVEIKEINELTSKLISKIINSTSLTQITTYQETTNQIASILKDLKVQVGKTHNQKDLNVLIFDYKSEFNLMRSQVIFLQLGHNIVNMLDTLTSESRGLCFEILETLLEREEFALSSMTLIANYDSKKEKMDIKIKVLEDYLDFFVKILNYTLEKYSSKVNDPKTKYFIEKFLAIAYMRVPKFQHAFLEAVKKNVDLLNMKESCSNLNPFIGNYGAISNASTTNLLAVGSLPNLLNYNEVSANTMTSSNMSISLLDWQSLFNDKLEKIPDANFMDKFCELDEILSRKSNWSERISKRRLGFYNIISQIEKYIYKKIGTDKHINWLDIPGFKIIISAILHDLRTKEVHSYPEPLINLLKIFINDYGIMNKFYKTILDRTNAYDVASVFKAIKIIDIFFKEYETRKEISDFAYKFDYTLLKQAVDAIFKVNHSVCVAKLIWLYYNNAHIMNIAHVHEIFSEHFKTKFFHLFFHWSWQVRDMFYHFLWYIINHRLKYKNFINEQSNLCKERLEYLSNKDDVGFFKAFNNEYPEELKKLILGDYYEKVRIAEMIRTIVKKEKLDPNKKNEFTTNDPKILANINEEIKKSIVIGIYHYDSVEKSFRTWEKENRNNKEVKYRDIQLTPLKDDVAEYSTSENVDSW